MLRCSILHLKLGSWPGELFHVAIVVVLQISLLVSLFIRQLILVHEEAIGESQVSYLILIFYYFVGFF